MTITTSATPPKPALTELTPVEANRILTHFVHRVHPELRPLDIKPSRQRLALPGLHLEIFDRGVSSEFSHLASAHFGTHFMNSFDGLTPELDLFCRVLTAYALASTGEMELTEHTLAACQPVLKQGWQIIDAAKRAGSPYVRGQAVELEAAIQEFYARQSGEKFYTTRPGNAPSR